MCEIRLVAVDGEQSTGRWVLSSLARSYDLHAASVGTALHNCFAAGLLGYRPPFRTIVVPQSTQHLAGDHLAHVHADQPDNEHAVAS